GLEALDEAGAGEDDGFEEVAFGADGADAGQVGADVSTDVTDGVAGGAGSFRGVEDRVTAAGVAGGEGGEEVGEGVVCVGGVWVGWGGGGGGGGEGKGGGGGWAMLTGVAVRASRRTSGGAAGLEAIWSRASRTFGAFSFLTGSLRRAVMVSGRRAASAKVRRVV